MSVFFLCFEIKPMNKQRVIEVQGYLHEVSELLEGVSSEKYFTAVLQQEKHRSKLVVFDHHWHPWYQAAANDQ